MDTDSLMFSFNPIKRLIKDLKQFSKELDISEADPTHDLYSKDNMKVKNILKFESYLEIEIDEAVFFLGLSYTFKKPSNSIETNTTE